MANARSPNYPAIGLPAAIDRLAKVYEKEHLNKAPADVVAKALGYQGLNGASITVLSALKKFGLLDEVGKDLKVSQDGLIILAEPVTSLERAEVIRRVAFAPTLFEDIRKNYPTITPSDDNLRSFLLRKGFLPTAVDAPIRAYRETIALVNALPKADNPQVETDLEDEDVESQTSQPPQAKAQATDGKKPSFFASIPNGQQVGSAIPVTANCSMTIIADGTVTQEGLARLVQYIDLIKTWFPPNEQPTE